MNSDPEAPPLKPVPTLAGPSAPLNATDVEEDNAQILLAVLKLLAPVGHLYLEKDASGPDAFLVVDNLGRRLFNVSFVQGRVTQVGFKNTTHAVSTYVMNLTNVEGHKMTFDFHKNPFGLCGGKRMLGVLPENNSAGPVQDFNFEDRYYINSIGGDSTCLPCRIKALNVVDSRNRAVVGKISVHWPERPGVYGVQFPHPTLKPEVKLLCLAEALTEFRYYFKKQCCCGFVGERGSHCILFYIITLICVLLLVAGSCLIQFYGLGQDSDSRLD